MFTLTPRNLDITGQEEAHVGLMVNTMCDQHFNDYDDEVDFIGIHFIAHVYYEVLDPSSKNLVIDFDCVVKLLRSGL